MTDLPNPDDFSKDDRPREFRVCFQVRGEIEMTIDADDEDDARRQAERFAEDEDFACELDTADDVRVYSVRKSPPMYRVMRDGQKMSVSHLQPGDVPREPDERGF